MAVNINQVGYERRLAVVGQLLYSRGLEVGNWSCREVTVLSLIVLPAAIQYLDSGIQ